MSRRQNWRESKHNVKLFLDAIHTLTERKDFDLENDFTFNTETGRTYYDYNHSNTYMLEELGYTKQKVLNTILLLTVADYVESSEPEGINIGDVQPFFIFSKTIDGNEIYIKLQRPYREGTLDRYLNCVSFHISGHHMKRPYKDIDLSELDF